ncbi:hypothetical protein [Actinomadura sp. WAC 06369]|uniref:hypothetical protein n=1 Tax=Actinomadura sp. WAC 06369 TaxID=2203193 RepID=UPI000F778725|nr:hypothetical protein [Actinomadura sp. WAC 06369]RSN56750.1 hypothetical protein DMH08_24845 [Actinomadura sp. WAC 06369]
MSATLGLVLLVQGGGGLINNLFADSKSWFLLNHLDMPAGARLAGHAVMLAVGLLLVARRGGWARLLP